MRKAWNTMSAFFLEGEKLFERGGGVIFRGVPKRELFEKEGRSYSKGEGELFERIW